MYVYANGCSFTYGSELHDDPQTRICTNNSYRWEHSWPGALTRLLGVSGAGAYNDATPSGSNDRITRTTVQFVLRNWQAADLPAEQLLVVIGWSHPARREFFVDGAFRQVVPHHGYDIRALDRLARVYRQVAWDDTESRWRFATQALTLASFLRDLGIRFVFFDAIEPNRLPDELADDPAVPGLLGGDSWIRGSDDLSMARVLRADPSNWTGQHPSETGHAAWAALLAQRLGTDLPAGPPASTLKAAGLPQLGGTRAVQRHDVKEGNLTGMRPLIQHAAPLRRRIASAVQRDPFLYP